MKFLATILFYGITITNFGAATQWYDPAKDLTCTVGTVGGVNCEEGHLYDAPNVHDVVESPNEGNANALDERASCSITIGAGPISIGACFAHCYLLEYCNADCVGGICHCKCLDNGAFCVDTTCS